MSRSNSGDITGRGQRLPIGYRIQTHEDGTLEVMLETIEAPADVPLNSVHGTVLDDYKAVRRAVRTHNQKRRAARPE